ncbi:MAG: sulfotransferase [Planctomycetaceae bacterium]|nr:sulfotransferase [Planctomycetaceae bacterium]
MADQKPVEKKEASGSADRFWHPRFWDGMTMTAWGKQASKGKFRIAPSGIAMFGIISGLSVLNSGFAIPQSVFYGRKIREMKLAAPPVFIIGHWRSGTTLLHEFMIQDRQFTFADTYSCFAPHHFLASRRFMSPMVSLLMPKKRPMDNMAAGLDHPQEDEFALCAMGMPSPYLNIIYPNNEPIDADFLTLKNVSQHDREKWLDGLEYFLKCLTVADHKQIILKSPPHTARISTILQRFPDAKFVHIHRNPYTLYASTFNLWMQLAAVHALQRPTGKMFEERIFVMFEEMYKAFAADISLLKPDQWIEVGFKELTSNPVSTLEKIYSYLHLNGFEQVKPAFETFAASQKSYRKNKFETDPAIEAKITERWKWYIERYGYEKVNSEK